MDSPAIFIHGQESSSKGEAIELIRSKTVVVDDMITHRLPLADASEGFALVERARESLKVIIEP